MLKMSESAEVYGMMEVMAFFEIRRLGTVSLGIESGKTTLLFCLIRPRLMVSDAVLTGVWEAWVVSSCAQRENPNMQNISMMHILRRRWPRKSPFFFLKMRLVSYL
jgi:hypothetical protein